MDVEDLDSVQQSALMLVGATPKGLIDSKMRVQKLAFLFSKSLEDHDLDAEFSFEPYNLGPYSENLENALDLLAAQGLLLRDPNRNRYTATAFGRTMIEKLVKKDPTRYSIAEEIVHYLGQLNPYDLAAAVYELYPEYASKSTIAHQLKGRKAIDSVVIPLNLRSKGEGFLKSRLGRTLNVSFVKDQIWIDERIDD